MHVHILGILLWTYANEAKSQVRCYKVAFMAQDGQRLTGGLWEVRVDHQWVQPLKNVQEIVRIVHQDHQTTSREVSYNVKDAHCFIAVGFLKHCKGCHRWFSKFHPKLNICSWLKFEVHGKKVCHTVPNDASLTLCIQTVSCSVCSQQDTESKLSDRTFGYTSWSVFMI